MKNVIRKKNAEIKWHRGEKILLNKSTLLTCMILIILVDLLAEDNYFRDNKCYHNSKHISRQSVSNCIADIYYLELRKKQQIKQGDKVIDNQHYFIDFSWILFK